MATMAPAPTTTATITPPRSSHGVRDSWGYSEHQKEGLDHDTNTTAVNHHEDSRRRHFASQNGNTLNSSYHSGIELASRKMNSTEHMDGPTADDDHVSPYPELKPSPTIDGGSWGAVGHHQNGDENKRNSIATLEQPVLDENSKWIHRDKLARIENEELQAAGIYIPRTRATSKQRRDRSRSAMRRGTDASENATRSRKNSTAVIEPLVNTWDLRTPEEIAEEEANNAYFNTSIPTSLKGGSRIPVAKISPAPAGGEHFDRTSWKTADSPEEDAPLTNQKTRSRSASMKGSDAVSVSGTIPGARRSATDVSPKKSAASARKTSGQSRTGPTGRPKTRSGSTKESNGSISTRPSTRSGDLNQGTKAPEGDPPWLVNAYKPDPRLPPDQQLLPTVARRLQQEKWEKEGKFGDVYDKEFRPLNDNVMLKPLDLEKNEPADEEAHAGEDEWPLKEPAKSPRQGSSYSTMPKISDKPHTPLASPRTPVAPHAPVPVEEPPKPTPKPTPERVPPEPIEDSKGGCGCCVVM
ncbi:hypothetical protein EDB81DRAFT_436755 [Dactylonectria macrodidyma]|uniref:TeaA receptor TeaR n=1 Tax=Dactylonectria macrodidyma TaxID=307937 RepID=A0A9P9JDA7_9HYPO|nr:hypothetical protein EDB81DRAFT_436755 [Dactylonectria macrodidyma]